MNADVSTADAVPTASGRLSRVLRAAVTGVGGLAYAFIIWTAVFYAIQITAGGMSGYGWFILLLPAIVAAVVFVVVLVLLRRRGLGAFALAMLAGLGLSAVFLLDTFSYVIRNLAALTGA